MHVCMHRHTCMHTAYSNTSNRQTHIGKQPCLEWVKNLQAGLVMLRLRLSLSSNIARSRDYGYLH